MHLIPTVDLEILNKSEIQLSHFIAAEHKENIAHLLEPDSLLLTEQPSPPSTPSPTDLNTILNNAVKAPGTTSIATVPNTPSTEIYQMLGQIQTLDSYISLLTALCIYNEHPAPYDITKSDQASAFTRAQAKWRNYVTTGGKVTALAGYLPVTSIVSQNYSRSVTSADLHLEFLASLFGEFGFPEATIAELDVILTKVVEKLGSLELSFETEGTSLDHFLSYYYFATVPGTGEKGQPPSVYMSKMRTFFLHIDQASWNASLGKSSVEHFQFNMNFFDMDTAMNSTLVANDMSAINSSIQTLTDQSSEQINKLMNLKAVHADPQKA